MDLKDESLVSPAIGVVTDDMLQESYNKMKEAMAYYQRMKYHHMKQNGKGQELVEAKRRKYKKYAEKHGDEIRSRGRERYAKKKEEERRQKEELEMLKAKLSDLSKLSILA
jgi:Skp family chaperone for outer membrane proteins